MTSTENDVPYHMQEDSDEEPDNIATKDGATEKEQVKEQQGFLARRRAKIGKVELDPKIRQHRRDSLVSLMLMIKDYADFRKDGPGLESRASLDDMGMINIWVDLKKALPDLPKDYAVPVEEYAIDPVGSKDCPPLNIVIFIVGSRGRQTDSVALMSHRRRTAVYLPRTSPYPFSQSPGPNSYSPRLPGVRCRLQQATLRQEGERWDPSRREIRVLRRGWRS